MHTDTIFTSLFITARAWTGALLCNYNNITHRILRHRVLQVRSSYRLAIPRPPSLPATKILTAREETWEGKNPGRSRCCYRTRGGKEAPPILRTLRGWETKKPKVGRVDHLASGGLGYA